MVDSIQSDHESELESNDESDSTDEEFNSEVFVNSSDSSECEDSTDDEADEEMFAALRDLSVEPRELEAPGLPRSERWAKCNGGRKVPRQLIPLAKLLLLIQTRFSASDAMMGSLFKLVSLTMQWIVHVFNFLVLTEIGQVAAGLRDKSCVSIVQTLVATRLAIAA